MQHLHHLDSGHGCTDHNSMADILLFQTFFEADGILHRPHQESILRIKSLHRRCKRTRTGRDQNPVILLCLLLRFHQMLFCMYPDDRLLNQVKRYLLPDLIQIPKRKQAVKLQLSKRIVGCQHRIVRCPAGIAVYIDLPLLITGADRFNRMITCRAESYHSIVHVFPPLKYRKSH